MTLLDPNTINLHPILSLYNAFSKMNWVISRLTMDIDAILGAQTRTWRTCFHHLLRICPTKILPPCEGVTISWSSSISLKAAGSCLNIGTNNCIAQSVYDWMQLRWIIHEKDNEDKLKTIKLLIYDNRSAYHVVETQHPSPVICLGHNKDLWSWRSKGKSYGAPRGCNLGARDCLQVCCGK